MRKTFLSLAVRAIVLAASFASIAQAATLERDHRDGRSDLVASQTVASPAQAGAAIVQLANLERQNAEERADL